MQLKHTILFTLLFILTGFFTHGADGVFLQVQRIKISTDQYYPVITTAVKVPDGYIVVFKKSSSGNNSLLVKLDKKATFISKYDSSGFGPGELNTPNGIYHYNGEIFVGEFYTPIVHVYSNSLQFKRDHRVKRAGRILFVNDRYLGLWSKHYKDDLVYLLSLYDSNSLAHKKNAFPVHKDEIPAFVQNYGNVTPIDDNNFIGIFSSDFQIKLFNSDFDLKGTLVKKKPDHVRKYFPWKKNRGKINVKEADEWLKLWTVAHSVFYVDNHFVINYEEGGSFYLDVMDREGKFLHTKYKVKWFHLFSDGKYLFRYEEKESTEDEIPSTYFIKERLITGKQPKKNVE